MTSRRRSRWHRKWPAGFLLCIAIGTVYGLGRAVGPGRPARALTPSEETGTCLDRRIGHLHVVNTPLERVVDDLSRQTGQSINVEWEKIRLGEGPSRQAKVTIDFDNVTLYSALQTLLGTVRDPIRFGVYHGVVSVSSEIQKWDSVVRTYDVSDLLRPFSGQPDPGPPQPMSASRRPVLAGAQFSGSPHGSLVVQVLFKTGRIAPSGTMPTSRGTAMDALRSLACSVLVNNPLGSTSPTVTQWGERLLVVATEPQQRALQQLMTVLRGKIAARANTALAAPSLGLEGTAVPPMNPPDDADAIFDWIVPRVEIPRTSLRKALDTLCDQTGAIFILEASGLPMEELVEAHLTKVTVFSALNAILRQVKPIPPFFAEGRALVIGEERKETRIYDIRPLLSQDVVATEPAKEAEMDSLSRGLADRIERLIMPPPFTQLGEPNIPVMEWDGILVVHETPERPGRVLQLLNQEQLEEPHP